MSNETPDFNKFTCLNMQILKLVYSIRVFVLPVFRLSTQHHSETGAVEFRQHSAVQETPV